MKVTHQRYTVVENTIEVGDGSIETITTSNDDGFIRCIVRLWKIKGQEDSVQAFVIDSLKERDRLVKILTDIDEVPEE